MHLIGEYTFKSKKHKTDLSVLVEVTDEAKEQAQKAEVPFRSLYTAIMSVPAEQMAEFEKDAQFVVYSEYIDALIVVRITFSGFKRGKILKTATVTGIVPEERIFRFKKRRFLFEAK